MWNCPGCGELVEEDLESCWNCGSDRDGEIDPDFRTVQDDESSEDEVCPRCGGPADVIDVGGLVMPQPICFLCQAELENGEDEECCCPRDGTVLEKERYRNVIIDRCPECDGVWLDAGELEQIEHAARAGG